MSNILRKVQKTTQNRAEYFKPHPSFFDLFSTLGPNGGPGWPPRVPGTHFDLILATFSTLLACILLPCIRQKKHNPTILLQKRAAFLPVVSVQNARIPAVKSMTVIKKMPAFRPASACTTQSFLQSSPGPCSEKASIPPCFQHVKHKNYHGQIQDRNQKKASILPWVLPQKRQHSGLRDEIRHYIRDEIRD